MIQRIQSVYLFGAIIALTTLFFFPLISYYGDLHTYSLQLLSMKSLVPDSTSIFHPYFTLPLVSLVVFMLILSLVTLFSFKKRKFQMKLVRINMLLSLLFVIGLLVGYTRYIQSVIEVEEQFQIGVGLPIVALILFVLAFRAIKKDEQLVRSADRLR